MLQVFNQMRTQYVSICFRPFFITSSTNIQHNFESNTFLVCGSYIIYPSKNVYQDSRRETSALSHPPHRPDRHHCFWCHASNEQTEFIDVMITTRLEISTIYSREKNIIMS